MRHSLTLSTISLVSICGTASASVMFIDFGRTDRQSDPLSFNNIVPGVQFIADAIDENGVSTGMGIEVVDPFFVNGEPSSLGAEIPLGDAAQFGVEATDDYLFGHTVAFAGAEANPLAVIEFQNLDANSTYSFTIFAARVGVSDNREAQYDLVGGNNASGALDSANNDSEVLVLSGLIADDNGMISLSVSPGANNDNGIGFFYLGAIRVDSSPVPAPGTAALFGAAGLMLCRRRR